MTTENRVPAETVTPIVRHCTNTYSACCLPWGWCNCICGDCRVAKYQEAEEHNRTEAQP